MAQLNADVSNVQPNEGRNFTPLPAGWAIAQITDSDMVPNKAQTGHYLKLEFTLMEHLEADEPFAGRKVWANLNLDNPNAQAVEIAYGDLSAIGHAVGVTKIGDSVELHGKPLEICLRIKPASGDFAAGNEITAYRACRTATTPGAANGASASAPGSAPPWAKR